MGIGGVRFFGSALRLIGWGLLLILAVHLPYGYALADDSTRTWNDKSGRFQIEATLLEHDEKSVRLKKTDGRVISVKLEVLSEADAQYIKQLAMEAENPFAGGELMEDAGNEKESKSQTAGQFPVSGETKELPANGKSVYITIDQPMPAVQPDPGQHEITFKEFARPIAPLDAYARVSDPILVDPSGPVFAVSTHRNRNAVSPDNHGRIYLVSNTSGQAESVFESEETLMLVDHNMKHNRSLAVLGVNSPSDRGGDLILIDGLATRQPKAIQRWHLPEWDKVGFKPKVEMAVMLDKTRAIVQVDHSIYCWSLDSGKCHFVVDRVPASGKVCVSSGGRYLSISVSGGTHLIDIAEAELIGKISIDTTLTPETHFSPDGTRVALVAGSHIAVWNLQSAGMELEDTIGSVTGRFVGWVGDQSLLTQFFLIDLELGQPIWKYHLPSSGHALTIPGGLVTVDKNARPATLMSVPIPHISLDQVKAGFKQAGDEGLLVSPGSEVMLVVSGLKDVDEAAMLAGLTESVKRAGWKVVPKSDTVVTATISRGEKQKLTFRHIGSLGERETVTLKPFRASVTVSQNNKTLWQRSPQNTVPFILRLGGQTLRQALKEFEKVDPDYFRYITIPPKLYKPDHRRDVGRSRLKNGRWVDF